MALISRFVEFYLRIKHTVRDFYFMSIVCGFPVKFTTGIRKLTERNGETVCGQISKVADLEIVQS